MYRYSLLVVTVLLGLAQGVRSEDTAKKDLAQFQGSWKAIAMHSDGQPSSKEDIDTTRLLVEGNKFTLTGKNFSVTGTFTIDPTKSPKTIDVLLTPKDGGGAKLVGVYRIEGDKRQSCFALSEVDRPTKFSPGKGYFGFEWKRN